MTPTTPGPPGPTPGPPAGLDPRTWHFRDFYGLADDGRAVAEERGEDGDDLLLVHGNCQAEALRVVLAVGLPGLRTVRAPAVHELVADDVPYLQRVLRRCAVVVCQPVRSGYHGLPLGTADVLAAAPQARPVLVPVVRDSRLHPFQALVRVDGAGEPPVVPYHDLRTLAVAAQALGERPAAPAATDGSVSVEGVREVARRSRAELRRREQEHGTLPVHDLLDQAGAEASHTLNHPGNPVLVGLAQRVIDDLGEPGTATDPGRVLLRSVVSPLGAPVLDALGLDPAAAREDWLVGGEPVEDEHVRSEQLRWYAEHPEVVRAGLRRHAGTMSGLGL